MAIISNNNYEYFKTPLILSGGTKQQLSGNITITLQTSNNSTGATIKLGDYLSTDFINQFYLAEIGLMTGIIFFIGLIRLFKDDY